MAGVRVHLATLNVRKYINDFLQQGPNPPPPTGLLTIPLQLLIQAAQVANNDIPYDMIFVTQTQLANPVQLNLALNLLAPPFFPSYRCLSDGNTGPAPLLGCLVYIRNGGPLDAGGVLLPVAMLVPNPMLQPIINESRLFVYSFLLGVIVLVNNMVPANHHAGVLRRVQLDLLFQLVLQHPAVNGRLLAAGGHVNSPEGQFDISPGQLPWTAAPYLQANTRLQNVMAQHQLVDVLRIANPGVHLTTDLTNHYLAVFNQPHVVRLSRSDSWLISAARTQNATSQILTLGNQLSNVLGAPPPAFGISGLPVAASFVLQQSVPTDLDEVSRPEVTNLLNCANGPAVSRLLGWAVSRGTLGQFFQCLPPHTSCPRAKSFSRRRTRLQSSGVGICFPESVPRRSSSSSTSLTCLASSCRRRLPAPGSA